LGGIGERSPPITPNLPHLIEMIQKNLILL
jgi:hypothetical protein